MRQKMARAVSTFLFLNLVQDAPPKISENKFAVPDIPIQKYSMKRPQELKKVIRSATQPNIVLTK